MIRSTKEWRRAAAIGLVMMLLTATTAVVQAGVGLTHFDAAPGPGAAQITVSWETETEVDTVGFRVVRSTQPLVQTAVAVQVVAAVGSATTGAQYQFIDSDLIPGQRYYYWLYEITSSGDAYLISQAATAVAPAQSTLSRRAYFPLAFRSN